MSDSFFLGGFAETPLQASHFSPRVNYRESIKAVSCGNADHWLDRRGDRRLDSGHIRMGIDIRALGVATLRYDDLIEDVPSGSRDALLEAVQSGSLRQQLTALRDALARSYGGAGSRDQAPIAAQLRQVLIDLDGLPLSGEESTVDDLAAARAARRAGSIASAS
jgi:hypothetical protein